MNNTYQEKFNQYGQEADAYAQAFGLDGRHNGEWDAFRHAYSSAAASNEFGTDVANLGGWLHEKIGEYKNHNLPDGDPGKIPDEQYRQEMNMDLWNNALGRDVGLDSNDKDEIAQKILDKLHNGELIADPQNDSREYHPDPDDIFPNGLLPYLFAPLSPAALPSDFLGDLGKELGKLLDMLPDDLVPDFIDGLLGGLDDIFPNGLLPYLFNLFPVDLDPLINVPWKEAMYLDFWISPLVLDLDGDGVETFGITSDKQVLFDHDGDGVRNGTGWVKSDDGLLVA